MKLTEADADRIGGLLSDYREKRIEHLRFRKTAYDSAAQRGSLSVTEKQLVKIVDLGRKAEDAFLAYKAEATTYGCLVDLLELAVDIRSEVMEDV